MNHSDNITKIPLQDGYVRFFHATDKIGDMVDVFAEGLNFERYPSLLFKAFGPFYSAEDALKAHVATRDNSSAAWSKAWILYFDVPEDHAEDFLLSDAERTYKIDKNVYHEYCRAIFASGHGPNTMDAIVGGTTKYPAGFQGSYKSLREQQDLLSQNRSR